MIITCYTYIRYLIVQVMMWFQCETVFVIVKTTLLVFHTAWVSRYPSSLLGELRQGSIAAALPRCDSIGVGCHGLHSASPILLDNTTTDRFLALTPGCRITSHFIALYFRSVLGFVSGSVYLRLFFRQLV
jgi:hypothetical protein